MKMRRRMVVTVNINHNPEEAANTWHSHNSYCEERIAQTFSGLIGISRCVTPYGDNASTTAFTIAGVAPIVPASPTPFTPSGFTGEGVSVRSVSNHGICEAFGSA